MKVYISGKITGLPNYKKHFTNAENKLKALGHEVVNPSCLHHGMTYKQYIDITLEMLKSCDAICMLGNYHDSKGALFELHYAQLVGLERIVL